MEEQKKQENGDKNDVLATCREELARCQDQYTYLLADFENHRRREQAEYASGIRRAEASILLHILDLVDNFERAFKETQHNNHISAEGLRGFELIYKDFLKILARYEVTEMPMGSMFDPEYHEALMHIHRDGVEEGVILDVLRKGYVFRGRILRPAQVSVARSA